MPWPIMTDQIHLDAEKDAANAFLKFKGLPLIESLTFVDDEVESYIKVNNVQYCISHRIETVMMKNLRGEYPYNIDYLCAWYVDNPNDPTEDGGQTPIYKESHFGSLSYFLIRIALERVFHEWRNFHHG